LSQTSQSPLDGIREKVEALFGRGLGDQAVADVINADVHGTYYHHTEFVTPPTPASKLLSVEDLIRERGLDPEEWDVERVMLNNWNGLVNIESADYVRNESQVADLKQLKVWLKRKKILHLIVPARVKLDLAPDLAQAIANAPILTNKAKLVVYVGDQQAPYHNVHLHELFLQWLHDNKPEEGVLMGDGMDLPTISRHKDEPAWAAAVQECINAYGQIIYDYRKASPKTKWTKLVGNHDERIRRANIDHLANKLDVTPAQIPGLKDLPPIHSLNHLLRLDELGVMLVEPKGGYEHAKFRVTPELTAIHGHKAQRGSGTSARSTLDDLAYSVIMGHTHRQAQVFQTKHTADGKPYTITAVETGCMCRIEEGLGYAVDPDWQNGFATSVNWPSGKFNLSLASYVDRHLLWQDQSYS
jgi:hypothetical protein